MQQLNRGQTILVKLYVLYPFIYVLIGFIIRNISNMRRKTIETCHYLFYSEGGIRKCEMKL